MYFLDKSHISSFISRTVVTFISFFFDLLFHSLSIFLIGRCQRCSNKCRFCSLKSGNEYWLVYLCFENDCFCHSVIANVWMFDIWMCLWMRMRMPVGWMQKLKRNRWKHEHWTMAIDFIDFSQFFSWTTRCTEVKYAIVSNWQCHCCHFLWSHTMLLAQFPLA